MGYYIRLLSPSRTVPAIARLRAAVAPKPHIALSLDAGAESDWSQLVLAHTDGTAIASVERNVVQPGQLGAAEIAEFLDGIKYDQPASAVAWLAQYLSTVQNIYAFQILSGADKSGGWQAVRAVREAMKEAVGGITQADGEGFSNEEGFHILWQFSQGVKGAWWMAVLRDGEWVSFKMDLGKRAHRDAFLRGELPAGVSPSRPD